MNLLKKTLVKLGIFSMKDLTESYNLGKQEGLKIQHKILADFFEERVKRIIQPDE